MSSQLTAHDPALAALARQPADQPVALLHSGRFDARWATRSMLAAPQATFTYTPDHRSRLTGLDRPLTDNLFADLRTLLNDPDLPGPWLGYFSYDLATLIEPAKITHTPHPDWPLVHLAYCPDLTEYSATTTPPKPDAACPERSRREQSEGPDIDPSKFHPNLTRAEYESTVRRALDYIAAGDIFQVNLAQQFTTEFTGNPRDLYTKLAAVSPAWFGAYLEIPHLAAGLAPRVPHALLSTSPELFLHVRGGHVTTRPIKGTRPARHGDLNHHASELLHAEKDTAELNMIVDLMRNDLGRVCTYGSVRVTEPRTIETHPTIHHATATIEGDLHPSRDIVDLLKAALPGGSITGAPKVRAMQIIDELEPTPRGPYCGNIGLISQNELHLNIAIRTIQLTPKPSPEQSEGPDESSAYHANFSVGAGIVADSDPAAEYEETLAKARAMTRALSI